MPVGHLDQALLGVPDHEPPAERTRGDRAPEPDDHVECVLDVLELEREARRRAQAALGQDFARADAEDVLGRFLDLLQNSLDALRVALLEFG